jgi:hypothetical protein
MKASKSSLLEARGNHATQQVTLSSVMVLSG